MRWQTGETRQAVVFYADNDGAPALGLTPTCEARRVSTGVVLPSPPVAEVGGGFYRLAFTAPDEDSFVFLVDGGAALDAERRFVPVEIPAGGYVDRLDVVLSTRASAAAVGALGNPAQASTLAAIDAEIDELRAAVAALGSPAQAAALAALRAVADEVAAMTDVPTSTRATAGDVEVTVTAPDSYGGSLG